MCRQKSFYVGSTTDLERIDEAYYFEKQVQVWNRKKRIALINRDLDALKEFAKCRKETKHETA